MQDTRYILLVLLSSLLVLNGCSRRDILDDYPVSGVEISLNRDGLTDNYQKVTRLYFIRKMVRVKKWTGTFRYEVEK